MLVPGGSNEALIDATREAAVAGATLGRNVSAGADPATARRMTARG